MLPTGGDYHWRRDGERISSTPETITYLQQAVRTVGAFKRYSGLINDQSREMNTLRGLLELYLDEPIPMDEWSQSSPSVGA
ncbi:MAG: hypothetical protein R2838_01015 [Caldilineaceae bacterium]